MFHRPEECLTVRQALDLYTVAGAYTAMQEDRLGKLLPGYQADFIVLDTDVCARPDDLLTANVVQVWVAGQRKV
jgi:predicted amidohydrolase YtcJ